jgi:hypothetical protein
MSHKYEKNPEGIGEEKMLVVHFVNEQRIGVVRIFLENEVRKICSGYEANSIPDVYLNMR